MSGKVVRYYMRENPINGDVYMAESTPGCDADLYVLDTDYAALLAERDALRELLSQVAGCFTREDDLPDNLLPRIDLALTDQGRAGE